MKNIAESIVDVRVAIQQAEQQYQRQPGSVRLLAVSKTRPETDIRAALAVDQFDFGENYLQGALDKIGRVNDPRAVWHFIGPVQSNKTHAIARHFHWVHSVDRLKIAQRLNESRPEQMPPLNILVQINICGEPGKSGITPAELPAFIAGLAGYTHLRLRGLMALPEPCAGFDQQRLPFREVKHLFDQMNAGGAGFDTLSMGTTQDMLAAIAEGSTLVRIGTALFGARS